MNPTLVAIAQDGGGKPAGDRWCPLCAPIAGSGCTATTNPSGSVVALLELGALPMQPHRLWSDRTGARSCRREHWSLSVCLICGHVFAPIQTAPLSDEAMGADRVRVAPEAEALLARRLVDTWVLDGGSVVDAAAGDGRFLHHLADAEKVSALGFAAEGSNALGRSRYFLRSVDPDVVLRPSRLTDETELLAIDLLVLRHVLRDAVDPVAELTAFAALIKDPHHCLLYVEEVSAMSALRSSIWQLDTSARHFFSEASLMWLLNQLGFGVSYPHPASPGPLGSDALLAERTPDLVYFDARFTGGPPDHPTTSPIERGDAARIAVTMAAERDYWEAWLAGRSRGGRKVAVWGIGRESSNFCNTFAGVPALVGIVDPDGHHSGWYQAGTGLPVLTMPTLRLNPPDELIVVHIDDLPAATAAARDLGPRVEAVPLW